MKRPKITYILELTKKCNNNCLYCYNVWKKNKHYPKKELDYNGWQKVIDNLTTYTKPFRFGISGGEPLLHKEFFKILEYLQKTKVPLTLITNGTQLNRDKIFQCLKCGITLFELPLLGSSAKIHDKLTRNQGSWNKVINNINEIKKQQGNLTIVLVVTKKNIKDIKKTMETAIALGADAILANYFNPGGEGIKHINELMLDKLELEYMFTVIDRLAGEYEIPVSVGVPVPNCIINIDQYKNIHYGQCQIGGIFPYFAVDPAGNIRPCNHSSLIMGNILLESVSNIIGGNIYKTYCEARPVECNGCKEIIKCKGGCKASAEVCYNNINQLNPFIKNLFIKDNL